MKNTNRILLESIERLLKDQKNEIFLLKNEVLTLKTYIHTNSIWNIKNEESKTKNIQKSPINKGWIF